MSHIVTIEVEAPPSTVKVRADFYDRAEKDALLASPMRDVVALLPTTREIPTSDLCGYYLYYKLNHRVRGFSSHDEVARKWHHALVEFDGQFEFRNESLGVLPFADLGSGTAERLGEAIGLSVASELHDLHNADWDRIPTTNNRKTLDFRRPFVASDGRQFVQVETKGSSVADNDYKATTVSQHKASIKAKKLEVTDAERRTSVLYGTIGVVDNRPDSLARCWIVDPPANIPDDPFRFKVVTRLKFIAELVSLISARSAFAAAFQTRLDSLILLDDITPLDGQPLMKGDGSPYSEDEYVVGGRISFFQSKSTTLNYFIGGQISLVSKQLLVFIGIRQELVGLVAQQSFRAISAYSYDSFVETMDVNCIVPTGRFRTQFSKRITIPEGEFRIAGGYVTFNLRGVIYLTQSGLVYGFLPVPEAWQQ